MTTRRAAAESPGFEEWFDRVYPRLTGAGTWLRGGELNRSAVEEHGASSLRVLFARPRKLFLRSQERPFALLLQSRSRRSS